MPLEDEVHSTRIADGRANLVIGGDLVVTAEAASLAKIAAGVTRVVLNADAVPTLNQRLDPDGRFDDAPLARAVAAAAGEGGLETLRAIDIAERLMGDAIFANMLMLGFAWQKGGAVVACRDRARHRVECKRRRCEPPRVFAGPARG